MLLFRYVANVRRVWHALVLILASVTLVSGCTSVRAMFVRGPRVESVSEGLAVLRDNPDPAHRAAAYRYLLNPKHYPDRRIPGDVLETVVQVGLKEPEAIERVRVVTLLGRIEQDEVLTGLMQAAQDPDPLVRQAACEQLARWPSEPVVELLIERLNSDASIDVRLAAARTLGQIPSRRAAEALFARLGDPDVAVRYRVREALAALVGADYGFDAAQWEEAIQQASFEPAQRRKWWPF